MIPADIRSARKALGLTQSEMAQMLGYANQVRVFEIEAGMKTPGGAVIRLMRAYLDGYRPPDWPEKKRKSRV